MQSYHRLLIVVILSGLSGWFLLQKNFAINAINSPQQDKAVKVSNAQALINSSFPDIKGQQQAFKQWQGKIIVLNFWATWCPPCREEMPELSAMQDQYKNQNMVIVGLSTDDLEKTKEFILSSPVHYPILAGDIEAMNLAETLGNNRGILPYTVIIDTQGKVVKHFSGRINQQVLEKSLLPLLKVSAPKEN